ncbi:ribonuclease E inhibitor RraB [Priestia flexa]|uniref:ribonuclease E inhibitor RraB n=1 Tax=Priestia flexa TaxID=86664 RepID=UPI003D2956C5
MFPKDEDGQVLQMLYKSGVDFTKPHEVDFYITVPNQTDGHDFLKVLKKEGLECFLDYDEETNDWTCCCFKKMYLRYEDIINIQTKINELGKPYNAYVDGWGTSADEL